MMIVHTLNPIQFNSFRCEERVPFWRIKAIKHLSALYGGWAVPISLFTSIQRHEMDRQNVYIERVSEKKPHIHLLIHYFAWLFSSDGKCMCHFFWRCFFYFVLFFVGFFYVFFHSALCSILAMLTHVRRPTEMLGFNTLWYVNNMNTEKKARRG